MVEQSDDNADYIKFVGMVGHFFDNLSLTIKQITEKNNYSNSPSYGISVDIVEDMLASLGWEAEISKENLSLLLSSFSKNEFDTGSELYQLSRDLSEEQRNQIIWHAPIMSHNICITAVLREKHVDETSLACRQGIPNNRDIHFRRAVIRLIFI